MRSRRQTPPDRDGSARETPPARPRDRNTPPDRRDRSPRGEASRRGPSKRRARTGTTGSDDDARLRGIRWLYACSMTAVTGGVAVFGAHVGSLVSRIGSAVFGSRLAASPVAVDIAAVASTGVVLRDWSAIVALLAVVVGCCAVGITTVRLCARVVAEWSIGER